LTNIAYKIGNISIIDGAIAMKIRLFAKQDAEQVARLFHETVREINIRNYSSAQVEAWAPDDIYFRDWENICSNRFTYVADDEGAICQRHQARETLL
jgi:putative acetyltransferase